MKKCLDKFILLTKQQTLASVITSSFPFVPTVLWTRVLSFNVDQKNGLSFNGSLEDMFGYTVQQFENSEGKWWGVSLAGHVEERGGGDPETKHIHHPFSVFLLKAQMLVETHKNEHVDFSYVPFIHFSCKASTASSYCTNSYSWVVDDIKIRIMMDDKTALHKWSLSGCSVGQKFHLLHVNRLDKMFFYFSISEMMKIRSWIRWKLGDKVVQ